MDVTFAEAVHYLDLQRAAPRDAGAVLPARSLVASLRARSTAREWGGHSAAWVQHNLLRLKVPSALPGLWQLLASTPWALTSARAAAQPADLPVQGVEAHPLTLPRD